MSKVEITGYYLYLGTRAVGLPAPQTPQRASGSERFCKSAARNPATTAPPARKFHGSRILANLNFLASLDCSSKAAQGSRCWHWQLPQCFRFTILQARASASDITASPGPNLNRGLAWLLSAASEHDLSAHSKPLATSNSEAMITTDSPQ